MTRKRLEYIDMAKGVGIILVVLGHMENIGEGLRGWIQSFHMPLFFIIAGMLFCNGRETDRPFSEYAASKARSVMIPYLSFSILYALIDLIAMGFGAVTRQQAYRNVLDSVTLYGVSVMWFLPALFLGQMLFYLLLKKFPRRYVPAVSLILAAAACLANRFFDEGPLFQLYMSSLTLNCVINFVKVFLRAAVASSFICLGYFLFGLIKSEERSAGGFLFAAGLLAVNLASSWLNGGVDLHYMVLHNLFLYYAGALSGSFAVIFLCRNIRPVKLIMFYGKNSLIVMGTHISAYFVYIAVVLSLWLNQFVTRAKEYIFIMTVLLIIFAMEYPVILFFNRYLWFLLGRKRPAAKTAGRDGC